MPEGEVTALLVSQQKLGVDELQTEAFEALVRLRDGLLKATGASAVAYAIGLLTLSNMLTSLSASGMEIERGAFGHVALLLIGVTNLWWATTFAKVSYITTWFGWRMKSADPAEKAVMLLRFPEAFPYFAFFPGGRGYPKHIYPARSEYYQIGSLVLLVLGVLIFALGAAALNLMLAVEVWQSAYPTAAVARTTVAGSVVLSLLALAVPRFNDFKIGYHHYGLASLLASSGRPPRGGPSADCRAACPQGAARGAAETGGGQVKEVRKAGTVTSLSPARAPLSAIRAGQSLVRRLSNCPGALITKRGTERVRAV